MIIKNFGEIIKQRRKILAINQLDLSEISEVALHTISDIESGKGNPTLQVMNKICEILGLQIIFEVKGKN
ncbi:MAG: helix-turn-helix domain-containing protein [Candidatus Tenebribacter burtonii]|jgi:DNA-binding XRE family transcriptional regulator|nr:helix-turn-helix domain-containing protein [Candidatus Tenebribacter burtonii]